VPLTSEYPGQHLRDVAGGAAVGLAAAAAVFFSVADFKGTPVPEPSVAAAIWVTAVALIGGVALSVVIRLCAGASASLGQWLRRSAAGAVLLMPAAMAQTRIVDGPDDVSTCGTLLDPGLRAYWDPDGSLAAQCAVILHGRVVQLLTWFAVALAVALSYGVVLRRRQLREADAAFSTGAAA
jgi:hypothetical protein